MDPWFVTGFSEGAGSFTFSRSGRQLALYFAVKLPSQDRPLLESLRDYFGGAGTIYDVGSKTAYLRICRSAELLRVVEHFDRYPLRGVKAAAYGIWKQMVELKRKYRRPDREQLEQLAGALSAAVKGTAG